MGAILALVVVILLLLVAGFHFFLNTDNEKRDDRMEERLAKVEAKCAKLQDLLEDLAVGHINEARIKHALSRMFDTDEEKARR